MNPAEKAEPVEDWQGDDRWMSMHRRFLAVAKEKEPEVLFFGDSLIAQLQFQDVWKNMFEPLHCLNFGIGGDRIQHVLWRLENGELENLSPKIVVVMAGTNNYGDSAEQIAGGLLKTVKVIHDKQPEAFVIIMGLPPRGEKPNPLREKLTAVNEMLEDRMCKLENCRFLNADWSVFINAEDGSISHKDMMDYLHLTDKGYQKLCEPLLDEIQTYLKNFIKTDTASCGDLAL